ncbi:MAG: N-acetyl-gamma-glutamyl-phosphate reductase [Myxococcales bacterium]|nr:N-acetyl-gamma-glutamyl-phosphate reductase [Myxococcales bacterium]MCB9734751.1 N-acetyl-gamma-glutamyl-phosphate reductase [Deltaproteobacteria bacterium]
MGTEIVDVAVIGARGHTGAELLRLLDGHPNFRIAAVSSRALVGKAVRDEVAGGLRTDAVFADLEPADVAAHAGVGVWVLALPNGLAAPWVAAIDEHAPDSVIVDLSADYRFDSAWTYGLTEMNRKWLLGARRVANPGCYATGAQLALLPVIELLDGAPHVFGVSGYSGAGTTPSPRNDPEQLRDNLMPYSLVGHTHEQEIRWHLGHRVFFMPHVAPFFRGITLTISMPLGEPIARGELLERYRQRYQAEPLVDVIDEAPLVRDAANRHGVTLGGLTIDPAERHAVVVSTLDNLLKGAATQAMQNMNLACGFDELAGIRQHLVAR